MEAKIRIVRGFGVWQGLTGLFLLYHGAWLLLAGGSAYYLLAGVTLCGLSAAFWQTRRWAAAAYGGFVLTTALWAYWETGAQFWPFFARTFYFLVMGIIAALISRAWRSAGVQTIAAAAMVAGMFAPHGVIEAPPTIAPRTATSAPQGDWAHYGNNPQGHRFANLDQINRANVQNLTLAWTYRTGDIPEAFSGTGTEDQNTPLFIRDTVYVCTPRNTVIALDGETGAEKWKAPMAATGPDGKPLSKWVRCRGLAYADLAQVTGAAVDGPCARRIFVNTVGLRLFALDAATGAPCAGFGHSGGVDLREGIGAIPDELYKPTSAPTLAGRVVVVGSYVNDNVAADVPSGVVRAFDVVDGHMVWAFDMGSPEDHGPPAPGATYTRGSPNSWAPMSYDPALGLVFLPTGNASPDVWGGRRTAAEEHFASSVVALDAASGKVRWSFQTVHHDLWDYDVPMQPTLGDFPMPDGRKVPAVIFGTKLGQIYVLDRATGKPLTKVEERPVRAGHVTGERYAPTQPLSSGMPTIGGKTLRESDMWGLTPFDQLLCRVAFRGMRYTGLFDPPGMDRTLTFPGALGGLNWGGISLDPQTGTIFLNDLRLAQWYQLYPRDGAQRPFPMTGAPVALDKGRFMSVLGVPCQAPPFGTMTAVDLATRKVKWQRPMGTVEDTGPLGIKTHLPLPLGMPTVGGSLATGGGLLFFAATQDYYLRALDSQSGRELWKARLPVGSQGGPMTYRSPRSGAQFVVVTAGGARQSPDRGDYVIAYRLGRP